MDRVLVVRSVNDRRRRRGRGRRGRRQALGESDRRHRARSAAHPTLATRKAIERKRRAAMVDSMGEGRIDNSAAAGGAGRHIYVHIPFCARICPYCAFYKERADPAQATRFCEAILAELRVAKSAQIRSATGDGFFWRRNTDRPNDDATGLAAQRLPHSNWICRQLREWTLEANPGSVSERKARLLRERGVNRISLGVQSFDDGLLQLLGREHSAAQAEASFPLLRRSGFENLNIDLMFGLPGQTLAQWEATLQPCDRAGTRSCFRLLPDLRGGHRVLSPPCPRRIPDRSGSGRRFFCGCGRVVRRRGI